MDKRQSINKMLQLANRLNKIVDEMRARETALIAAETKVAA